MSITNNDNLNSKGFVQNRRDDILSYLKKNKKAKTNELSELLSISPLTIRRDLKILEDSGLVRRFYGGVTLCDDDNHSDILEDSFSNDGSFLSEEYIHSDIKHAIAKHAASLVTNGDIIFINSSSTALLMLKYLGDKDVVVVTNNANALNYDIGPNVELMLTGGEVLRKKHSMVGDFATYILSAITATKCFLGVSGITLDSGISTSVLKETLINKKMIERCNGPVYVLCGSFKVGIHHNFSSGDITDISHIITDKDINNEDIKSFEEKNIEVIAVDKNI